MLFQGQVKFFCLRAIRPIFFLREASMLYAFVLIVIVALFVSNAYAIWYAHTEQYKLDNRLDRVTRR
jgi:hypothetical protein